MRKTAELKQRSQLASIWRRFCKHKLAMVGLFVFCIIVFFAVFADAFADYEADCVAQNVFQRHMAPCLDHIMGTDAFGRDVFARIIFGARISLYVSLSVMLLSVSIGTIIGAVVGYYGGKVDSIVMRIVDVFLAVPSILLSVTVVAALGTGVPVLIVALTVSRIPSFIRIVRSTVMQVKGSDSIEAAVAYGTAASI